ncbi:hypothetical protein MBCUT_00810 [Methanobrevibacter cuticularis]|uniref:Uncharacterized protein n=1 Tax=Methanobrevibacter cuticularis TaxID=47311 RepID=A0A166FL30_9EURY|nr:hypothetical protein [Methanobrevibacter cuticularis]KZX17786.1 hypothetical protein MBCUT_00810 [Methanobrevibacter cuticularis]
MVENITETAEKKLKSRIRKFKKVLKDEAEKDKFFDQLGASVEIFLPTKNPEKQGDSIIFYTTAEGKIIDAEYSYNEGEENFKSIPIVDKDLDILTEVFKSNFVLE